MNTKLYLEQAWELLKQNRLFSTLYIVGTALAIAMTMMMAVIYYVRLAPVYPEERRATTLHMGDLKLSQTFDNGGWAWWTNGYSHRAVTEWFRPLEDAAVVSGYYNAWSGAAYVQRPDGREDEPVKVRLSDPEYFRLYTFRFKDGAAFTQDDFDGGMYRAVITDRLARLLFGADTGVTGRTFLMNYRTFTVCGVVEAPSKLMEHSYADMYAPYSIEKSLLDDNDEHAWEMGPLSITIAARDKEGIARIRQAIDEHIQRYNTSHQGENLTLGIQGGPRTHWQSVLESAAGSDGSMAKAVRQLLLIVLVLLLVPALNLSGLIASRMESRLAEMGIRKTFGAWRNTQHPAEYGALGEPVAHLYRWIYRAGDSVDMSLPWQRLGVHYTGQLCYPCAERCRLRQRRDAFRPAGFYLCLRSVSRAEPVVGLHPCLVVVASSHCPILV